MSKDNFANVGQDAFTDKSAIYFSSQQYQKLISQKSHKERKAITKTLDSVCENTDFFVVFVKIDTLLHFISRKMLSLLL